MAILDGSHGAGGLEDLHTLKVRWQGSICFIQMHRPEAQNTINETMIHEFTVVMQRCVTEATVVVVEGLPEVFCFGADFGEVQEQHQDNSPSKSPGPLYDLWLQLATGPFISVAHVRGKVNAGGVGFVAACDIVLSDETAVFSLSELLFGLMPACVLPFLVRRTGVAKANYMTAMTQPVNVQQAQEWGLVDATEEKSVNLLRRHLLRLRRLNKKAVQRYKNYLAQMSPELQNFRERALQANLDVFSDADNLAAINRYVTTGQFPWEQVS
ncbi:MAG: enoyl-CoA hydratase/isomerase [Aestuariibacter sp.]